MRILAVSIYYKPIRPGYGTRTPEILIDSACMLGHEVILYTGLVPKDMQIEENDSLKKFSKRIGGGNLSVMRLWTPTQGHHQTFRRSAIYSIFVLECFFRFLFEKDLDIVMGISPFPPFFVPLQLLSKLRRKKFYMHQGDLFPDTVVDLGVIRNPILLKLLTVVSIVSFKLSDIIGVNNLATKSGMSKYPIDQAKIRFIELAVDTNTFKPLMRQNNNGSFTVLYNGVFGPAYDFDIILDAAKELESYGISFVIAGQGDQEDYIRRGIKERNLGNTQLQRPVKKISELVKRLNECDIAVVCLVESEVSKTPHPSKIFEYMACGKPVVCAGAGAMAELIERSQGGVAVNPGNLSQFVTAILTLYNDRNMCQTMSENSRRYIEENHSMQSYMQNLAVILDEMKEIPH